MKKTYHGSCQCKAVTFEADIDLARGTGKCNCSFCWKQRMWKAAKLEPDDFRLLSGEDELADYAGPDGATRHCFCSRCGIATHTSGATSPFIYVQVAALDDLAVADLLAAPLVIVDGLHDNWAETPAETRHL